MNKKKIKAILFDMDGTLIDTLDDLTDSVNFVLKNNRLPERTREEVRTFLGKGIKWTIKKSVPEETREEIIEKCYEEMLDYYGKNGLNKTCPYEGIENLILTLHNKGYKIAIITNKMEEAAKKISDKFFGNYIDLVIGDDKIQPLKPFPNNIYRALKKFKLKNEEVIYIGDSEVDISTGKNASLYTIAVLWGFRDREALIKSGAENFAKNIEELYKKIEELK